MCAPASTTFVATNTKAAAAISRATNLEKREQRRRASAYRHRESEPLTDPWPRWLSIDISRMEQQSRVTLYVDICHLCVRTFICVCLCATVYVCVTLQFDSYYRVQPNRNYSGHGNWLYTYAYRINGRKGISCERETSVIFYVTGVGQEGATDRKIWLAVKA